jgi:hypothetical protein
MMPFAGFCFANWLPANTLVKQPKLKVRAAQIENFKAAVISDFAVVFTSFFSFVFRRQIAQLIFETPRKKADPLKKRNGREKLLQAASFGNSHYHVPTNRNLGW